MDGRAEGGKEQKQRQRRLCFLCSVTGQGRLWIISAGYCNIVCLPRGHTRSKAGFSSTDAKC